LNEISDILYSLSQTHQRLLEEDEVLYKEAMESKAELEKSNEAPVDSAKTTKPKK
jgi:hypothetical protein